jgi:hypothetical protein
MQDGHTILVSELSDLHHPQQGTAQFQYLRLATQNAKGSSHPFSGLSDLRRVPQGIAQFRHVR